MPYTIKNPSRRLARVLLMVSVVTLALAVFATAGWMRTAERLSQPVELDQLSAVDRQRVFDQMHEALPGIYEPTWYQPEIAYTLRPDTELSVWDDTFHSNELGFRTGPVRKRRRRFRILFVGDSWTYGMGVKEGESYPQVLARLANEYAGINRIVEAWTLALPGWNGINQTAALDFWYGRLRPDAVVFAPSSNDNDSAPHLLPSGDFFLGTAPAEDWFGNLPLAYYVPWPIDSYEYMARWRMIGARWRAAEKRLADYEIPTVFFFVALWNEELVHELVSQAALSSPYAVVPGVLTLTEWTNPTPAGHGTPEAHERYAQLLYRLLAGQLDWAPLPRDCVHPEIAQVQIFAHPPSEEQWLKSALSLRRHYSRDFIPASFRLGEGVLAQWPGSGSYTNGIVGRGTTVLVHPPRGTERLRVRLQRLETVRGLYPLEIELAVAAPGEPSGRLVTLPSSGPNAIDVELVVPPQVRGYSVLDVSVRTQHVASIGRSRVAGAFKIVSIEPG